MTTAVADHVVAKILESRSFSGKYGQMLSYKLVFEDGTVAELVQKPSTAAPQVGDSLHGQLEEGPYGMKFKKITPGYEQKDAGPASTSSMGSAPLPERTQTEWVSHPVTRPVEGEGLPHALQMQANGDHRQWSIVRQHSQAMAIDWIRAMMFIGAVTKERASVALVRRITDWFQADAEGKNPPDYTP